MQINTIYIMRGSIQLKKYSKYCKNTSCNTLFHTSLRTHTESFFNIIEAHIDIYMEYISTDNSYTIRKEDKDLCYA